MPNGEHPPAPRSPARRPPAHGRPNHPQAARGQPAHAARSGRHRLPDAQPVSSREVFASTEFRALWSAQLLSSAGDQLAAPPAGLLIGAFALGRLIRPADRLRPMGWLAMLSCAPLIFCQVHPPAPVVALLWTLAGAGGAYQLAAAAAFIRALPGTEKARAFAVAQSGLLAA